MTNGRAALAWVIILAAAGCDGFYLPLANDLGESEEPVGACGAKNKVCCESGDACQAGLACDANNKCKVCGTKNKMCCTTGDACQVGLECGSNNKCQTCGKKNGPCCSEGDSCGSGLACDSGEHTCKPCGKKKGDPCCPTGDACKDWLVCGADSICQACGTKDNQCCDETSPSACKKGHSCTVAKVCRKGLCGHPDGPCCDGSPACVGGRSCRWNGTCGETSSGGDDGEPCGWGESCGAGLACLGAHECVYDDDPLPTCADLACGSCEECVEGGASEYDYDDTGSMILRNGQALSWDGEGRPASAGDISYVYDGNGGRLKQIAAGGAVTATLGDDYEIEDGVATTYITAGGVSIAKRVGTTVYWLHTDHLGSVQAVTDASGGEVMRRKYLPYGETWQESPGHVETLGYTGQRQDDNGLFYLHARYYDPMLGRFISPDPTVPTDRTVGLNRYAYAYNDPVNYVDTTGLSPDPEGWSNYNSFIWIGGDAEYRADVRAQLDFFAATDYGKSFLARYAETGKDLYLDQRALFVWQEEAADVAEPMFAFLGAEMDIDDAWANKDTKKAMEVYAQDFRRETLGQAVEVDSCSGDVVGVVPGRGHDAIVGFDPGNDYSWYVLAHELSHALGFATGTLLVRYDNPADMGWPNMEEAVADGATVSSARHGAGNPTIADYVRGLRHTPRPFYGPYETLPRGGHGLRKKR